MTDDVLVVGGGIGGLTAAALLAARGLRVCVLERESHVGGCAASFEQGGYLFETGAGLYAGWQPDEIHERVFAELPVAAPEAHRLTDAYTVLLPDGAQVRVGGASAAEFDESLRAAFPECADAARRFYAELLPLADALRRAARRCPSPVTASRFERLRLIASEPRLAPRILAALPHTAAAHLSDTSPRFRRFVDAQLQIYAQRPAETCAYLYAAVALTEPLRGMYALRGGGTALAERLCEAVTRAGGRVRLDAPVLRLTQDAGGRAAGVQLLSGEVVEARRAVVSNLTVWDTYGKLLGAGRTPPEMRARLREWRGWGAYQLYLGLTEETARALPCEQVLALTDWQEGRPFTPESALFMLSAAPAWDARAPAGRRAATLSTFTEAEPWFTFQEDESAHEAADEAALAPLWRRLHAALPRLGADVELIETATPRTFYERTRRRLGMVGGLGQSLDLFGPRAPTHRTPLPNLFLVGDTVFPGNGVAAVTHSALIVANEIAPPA